MAIDFKTFVSVAPHVLKVRKPLMLRGRHGVGKSELVYQVGSDMGLPVVERRANYKGCVDPTGWLRRSGAPVLWVDDWSELPKVVAEALSDDAALEARRRAASTAARFFSDRLWT